MDRYQLVPDWPDLPTGIKLGNPTGIGLDSYQHLFIFHRAGRSWSLLGGIPDTAISTNTILMLDLECGQLINSWGDNIFIMPHGLTVDSDNNVWVTDVGLHQVFKYNHDGKLMMTPGEAKVPGNDATHFNRPTDVAITKEGSCYVSDGYGNNRIVKFSPDGKFLFSWGCKGTGNGEFNLPHAIDLDAKENVYVADRENNRVQVFDPAGKFMNQWSDKCFGKISSVAYDETRNAFIAADFSTSWFGLKHTGSDIIILDSTGTVTAKFGKNKFKKERTACWYHNIISDRDGNIYVTDILGNQVLKFKKTPGS